VKLRRRGFLFRLSHQVYLGRYRLAVSISLTEKRPGSKSYRLPEGE
jgi:hypothetical protein